MEEFVVLGSLGGHVIVAVLHLYSPVVKAFTMSLQTHVLIRHILPTLSASI